MEQRKYTTVRREFPKRIIQTVHQSGAVLSQSTGFEVLIHTWEGADTPHCAEVIGTEDSDETEYAEIGLWFEGRTLSDYDGVFSLPQEVATMLRAAGYTVPKSMLA